MYLRNKINTLSARLAEVPRFIQVVAGPRQVGKSTMVRQTIEQAQNNQSALYVAADGEGEDPSDLQPSFNVTGAGRPKDGDWIVAQWSRARLAARKMPVGQHFILVIDEIQKISRWSEVVKGLWDADQTAPQRFHVVLLGSSPWQIQKGLTESLAGRFEVIRLSHWSYPEMRDAFGFTLNEFIYFGGYPGAALFKNDQTRWRNYVVNSIVRPNVEIDILQMTRVDKPALLKALFEVGAGGFSGQILALSKLIEHLQEAGNTTTLSHYLDLLGRAELLSGIFKYAGKAHRQRASAPKFLVHNTALMTALGRHTFEQAQADREYWGRLVESAVGAHLLNTKPDVSGLFYWRESPHEVDFVLSRGDQLVAIEVKSGRRFLKPKGLAEFRSHYPKASELVVGSEETGIDSFLANCTFSGETSDC